MNYKGYKIVVRSHPTPFNENKHGYDVEDSDGKLVKANFYELTHCKQSIDKMIKLGHW